VLFLAKGVGRKRPLRGYRQGGFGIRSTVNT
jgi:hypothetical protein